MSDEPQFVVSSTRAIAPQRLAFLENRLLAAELTMVPRLTRVVRAHELIESDLVDPLSSAAENERRWLARDAVCEEEPQRSLSLPVVGVEGLAAFPDRWIPERKHVVPTFALERSTQSAVETSPFLFRFENTGLVMNETGTATQGRKGELRITLRRVTPPLPEGAVEALPIAPRGMSVFLDIPYTDAQTRAPRFRSFEGRAVFEGDNLTITLSIFDDWVRLAYAALSQAGASEPRARLRLGFTFPAFVERMEESEVLHAPRVAEIKAHFAQEPPIVAMAKPQPILDVPRASLVIGKERFALKANRKRGEVEKWFRPRLELRADVRHALKNARFAVQTVVCEQTFDVLFPCQEYGMYYREKTAEGEEAVGCRDALRLGEAPSREFEELTSLGLPTFRVFRRLSAPGTFLCVPRSYRLARSPETGNPVLAICAISKGDTYEYRFDATLVPDVSGEQQKGLEEALGKLLPQGVLPTIHFPTESPVSPKLTVSWLSFAVQTLKFWGGFFINLQTETKDAMLFVTQLQKDGIAGTVTFEWPDGTQADSKLALSTPGEQLVETRLVQDDIDITIQFLLTFAPADHGVQSISVEARLKGGTETRTCILSPGGAAALQLRLPIVSYLFAQEVEYRLEITRGDGSRYFTAFRSIAPQNGVVVAVQSNDLVQT